jgi:hypothetical protein
MPRPCSLCQHPEREAIDQALAVKEPYRIIAERFGTSPAALHRHQQRHAQPPAGVGPLGAPTSATAPAGSGPALVDTAHRVHASAGQLQRQTRDLRSVHQPELLERLENLADLLLEVTRLLVAITTPRL